MGANPAPNFLPRAAAPSGNLQKCVLMIDDSTDAMVLVRLDLRDFGRGRYRLEWANCLTDGLSQILKGRVDVVLLDLGLPESSGPSTSASVHEAAAEVPILVLTGDEREETASTILSSGFVEDYLVKGQISGTMLVQAIRAALASRKKRTELRGSGHENGMEEIIGQPKARDE